MKWIARLIKWIGIGIAGLAVAGAVYAAVGSALDAKLAPPRSEMVDVGGRRVHLVCTGQGERTFVLDAGLGGWSISWWRVQRRLEPAGRVCAFDRAGLGWSDESSDGYDGLAAARQLRALVRAAGIKRPFVYVGHSLGANFAQIYAQRFPEDIAALVLMEPGRPADLLEDFTGDRKAAMAQRACPAMCRIGSLAGFLGVARLGAHLGGSQSFTDENRPAYRAGASRPANLKTALGSMAALPRTAYEVLDVPSFGSTPVLVIASSESRQPEGKETVQDVRTWTLEYRKYLSSLAAMSTHGQGPVVIPGSNHSSLVTRDAPAAVVVAEIVAFAKTLRE